MQKVVGDLGAAFSIAPVRIGGALGIYGAMAELGATNSRAARQQPRDWPSVMCASGSGTRQLPATWNTTPQPGEFTLPPEHAFMLADPQSPAYVLPGFAAAVALSDNMPTVMQAFRTGEGVAVGRAVRLHRLRGRRVFPARLSRQPDRKLAAVTRWRGRATRGRRARCGCRLRPWSHDTADGQGVPGSRFIGIDIHAPSIEAARSHAFAHGKIDNLTFEIGSAQDFEGDGFDLVTCFDSLHDMGDPVRAAQRIRKALAPTGPWMIVEPFAQDEPESNFTPIGRMSYAASTMTCVPGALAQKGGFALGAQAGRTPSARGAESRLALRASVERPRHRSISCSRQEHEGEARRSGAQ